MRKYKSVSHMGCPYMTSCNFKKKLILSLPSSHFVRMLWTPHQIWLHKLLPPPTLVCGVA